MNRRQAIFTLGLLTFLLAFPNIPTYMKPYAFAAIGAALMAIAYFMRREEYRKEAMKKQTVTTSYVETH